MRRYTPTSFLCSSVRSRTVPLSPISMMWSMNSTVILGGGGKLCWLGNSTTTQKKKKKRGGGGGGGGPRPTRIGSAWKVGIIGGCTVLFVPDDPPPPTALGTCHTRRHTYEGSYCSWLPLRGWRNWSFWIPFLKKNKKCSSDTHKFKRWRKGIQLLRQILCWTKGYPATETNTVKNAGESFHHTVIDYRKSVQWKRVFLSITLKRKSRVWL